MLRPRPERPTRHSLKLIPAIASLAHLLTWSTTTQYCTQGKIWKHPPATSTSSMSTERMQADLFSHASLDLRCQGAWTLGGLDVCCANVECLDVLSLFALCSCTHQKIKLKSESLTASRTEAGRGNTRPLDAVHQTTPPSNLKYG